MRISALRILSSICFFRVGGSGNPAAATKFLAEYENVLDRLTVQAESYAFCEEDELRQHNYRRVRFETLRYKVFYRVDGRNVVIDLVTHDLQDYAKIL